ncbi:hypothetical protein RFI_18706 [Reticulomyxa filosa]|uniref:VWFA domain-containing protein n=1 Tax=Reticulomyxa filosa TaxID=46433 RepID=X6MXK9_RETFI|nr:hypothetical protein RFI_18706 [Reticulomyxa filosa]|eukprot:ETO18559.1 hypothetical protein RFI_18706 [Reticulomyxa filosa]
MKGFFICYQSVYSSLHSFVEERKSNNDLISLVLFHWEAEVVAKRECVVSGFVQKYCLNKFPSEARTWFGGTTYSAAFKKMEQLINPSDPNTTVIFLTDDDKGDEESINVIKRVKENLQDSFASILTCLNICKLFFFLFYRIFAMVHEVWRK